MKKILSLFLAISIIMTMGSSVYSLDNSKNIETYSNSKFLFIHKEMIKSITGKYSQNIIIKKLTDLSGNEFELIETGKSGYYIFDKISGDYIEFSPDAPSPYLGMYSNLKYFGPKCYYVKNSNNFSHTIIKNQKDISNKNLSVVQSEFDKMIVRSRSTINTRVLSLQNKSDIEKSKQANAIFGQANDELIACYWHIEDAIYPANTNGTCGYVAACLILNYWNKRKANSIIPSRYLDSNGDLLTTGYTLQDKLLSYGYNTSTWAKDIYNVFNDFCAEYRISATSNWSYGKLSVASELKNSRPVALFGYFPDESSNGYIQHAVTAYGLREGIIADKYIVHYGWSGYERIYLDSGLMGSNTRFKLK